MFSLSRLHYFKTIFQNSRKNREKGIFDTTLLVEAEKRLDEANAIAFKQVELFGSTDFKHWLINDRWTVGSWCVLINEWNVFAEMEHVDRLKGLHDAFRLKVGELDPDSTFPELLSEKRQSLQPLFNEMEHAGDVYLRAANLSKGRVQSLLMVLLAHVRSFIERLDDPNCDPEIFRLFTRGSHGDVLAGIVQTVLKGREVVDFRGAIDTDASVLKRKEEWEAFVRDWASHYNKKLGLRLLYGELLGLHIQKSIEMYLYYDSCGVFKRIILDLAELSESIAQKALQNMKAVAKQAVSWEFLKAGFMTTFWLLFASVYVTRDLIAGIKIEDLISGKRREDSWFHSMNDQITAAWNKSPATLFFVTFGILGSVVFMGLAGAATFGAAPAVAAALAITHSSIAVGGLTMMTAAAVIGGYAYKREQQLKIQNESEKSQAELDLLRIEYLKKLSLAEEEAKEKNDKNKKTAEEMDDEAEFMRTKEEFMRKRREDRHQDSNKKSDKGTNRSTSSSKMSSTPDTPSSINEPQNHASVDLVLERFKDMQKQKEEALDSIHPEEAEKIQKDIEKARAALAENVHKMEETMKNIEANFDEAKLAELRDGSD